MTSDRLAKDYLTRARARRRALDTLATERAWADVVREAQEVLELVFKGVLRSIGTDPPRRHDVLPAIRGLVDRLPPSWPTELARWGDELTRLAEERGHAFYGDEEELLTAAELFGEKEARAAIALVDRFLPLFEALVTG